ncbi:hypothetical protein SDJN02_07785, partial [Cucurbita argyrosperma subsp. argyrosperma]
MEGVLIPFSAERSRSLKSRNFFPATVHDGLLNVPPPAVPNYSHRIRQQPPLLPLPRRPFPPTAVGPLPSCRPKGTKSRDQSLTPKKSKPIKRSRGPPALKSTAEFMIVDSTNRLGPEPSHVPKDLWRVLGLRSSAPPREGGRRFETEFSGSAFGVSPPPSCVPLPKFTLRREVSCNVEAAGVDAGATDNLRRLLRLR